MGPACAAPLLACWLGLSGCTSTTTNEPASAGSTVLTPVPAVDGWLVVERGAVRGSVVRYREGGGERRVLYAVRNRWSQDLGLVDEMGRAWRRVPHRDDEWLGTGTVVEGARRILELDETATLQPHPVEGLDGAVERATGTSKD